MWTFYTKWLVISAWECVKIIYPLQRKSPGNTTQGDTMGMTIKNPHNIHHKARPWGLGMEYVLLRSASDICSTPTTAVSYTTSCYIGPLYKVKSCCNWSTNWIKSKFRWWNRNHSIIFLATTTHASPSMNNHANHANHENSFDCRIRFQ